MANGQTPVALPPIFSEDGREICVTELPPTPDLKPSERALLSIVVASWREFGRCRISNARLAELMGRCEDTTAKLASCLVRKKYLVRRLSKFNLRTWRVLKPTVDFETRLTAIEVLK